MPGIKMKTYGKINLALDILYQRSDGYHELKTIMEGINLADELTIETREKGIIIDSNNDDIPKDSKNIAYKAAEAFFKETKIKSGLNIYINKNIPVGAGLAGGSSNGAGVLIALNKIFNTKLTEEKFIEIGKKVGADVPFSIALTTSYVHGIGDKINKLQPIPKFWMVIAKPPISISTEWAYKQYSKLAYRIRSRPNIDLIVDAINRKEIGKIVSNIGNVFEEIIFYHFPEIKNIKDCFIKVGAENSLMSGSGSSVFGIFKSQKEAEKAKNIMEKMVNSDFYVCSNYSR